MTATKKNTLSGRHRRPGGGSQSPAASGAGGDGVAWVHRELLLRHLIATVAGREAARIWERSGLERVAVHEAAHAVVGRVLGLPVAGVAMDKSGRGVTSFSRRGNEIEPASVGIADSRLARRLVAGLLMAQRENLGFRLARWRIRQARRRARELLQGYNWIVFRLAGELLRSGKVDGQRIEAIFNEGGVYLPKVEWEAIA